MIKAALYTLKANVSQSMVRGLPESESPRKLVENTLSISCHSVQGLIKNWIISAMSRSPNLTFCQHWNHIIVQLLSCVQLFVTPWTAARQASLSFTIPQFAQTHVHWVGDAIQSSHFLSPLSPLALNLSQHQGLFQWVGSLHRSKVSELHHQSFQWTFSTDLL